MARTLWGTGRLATALAIVIVAARPAGARVVGVATTTQLIAACQSALPGDSILVAPGTYTWSGASTRIFITSRPGPVLLRSTTGVPGDVVIRGAGQDSSRIQMIFNLDDSPQWTFEAITTSSTYYHGFKFDHGSTDCVLRNVIMRDHGESGVKGTSDPPSGRYPDRLLVENCDIGFTSTSGGTRSVVEGVDGVGVNDWVIRYNRFVNVQKGGSVAYGAFTKGNASNTVIEGNVFANCFIGASFGGGGTGSIYFRDLDPTYETRGGIIRNNIVLRSSDAAIYVNKGHDCKVYNNTIFECGAAIQLNFSQTTAWVRNNLVKRPPANPAQTLVQLRNGATALTNEANLAAEDTDFLVASGPISSLDLHLRAGSTMIDAGVPVGSDVPLDIDTDPRPSGAGFDAGADERVDATDVVDPGPAAIRTRVLAVVPSVVRRGGDVRCELSEPDAARCQVFDAAGHCAMTVTIRPGAREFTVPVGQLPPGAYWLRVGSGRRAHVGRVAVLP